MANTLNATTLRMRRLRYERSPEGMREAKEERVAEEHRQNTIAKFNFDLPKVQELAKTEMSPKEAVDFSEVIKAFKDVANTPFKQRLVIGGIGCAMILAGAVCLGLGVAAPLGLGVLIMLGFCSIPWLVQDLRAWTWCYEDAVKLYEGFIKKYPSVASEETKI